MMTMLRRRLQRESPLTVEIRVRPHASVTCWKEPLADGTLRMDLAAPAEDGKANAELRRFLAEDCGIPLANVTVRTGMTGRRKVVRLLR